MINLAYLTMKNASFSNISSQYKESAYWFRKLTVVDPELSESYFNLGRIHEHGLGIERDLKGAY
jgi:TPR repeat protein